ncbi:MAG TPA: hypothetical protein VFB60_12170, partial [Ktedonobacteraceae bacterium]|nr:hypothetical protein [Ktedonobacteraceae bacterium]
GCCNVFFAAFGGGEKRKKWGHPTPRKEAAAPLTPAWQTVFPTLQQPCGQARAIYFFFFAPFGGEKNERGQFARSRRTPRPARGYAP